MKQGKRHIGTAIIFISLVIVICITAITITFFDYMQNQKQNQVQNQDESNLQNNTIAAQGNQNFTDINSTGDYILDTSQSKDSADSDSQHEYTIPGSSFKIIFDYFGSNDYWSQYDTTQAVYKTQLEFEQASLTYLNKIAVLLDRPDWYTQYMDKGCVYIKIKILDEKAMPSGLASAEPLESKMPKSARFSLLLSDSMFTHNNISLVYALSYIVIHDKSSGFYSYSLTEGLCQYIQNHFGNALTRPTYGVDIHNYLNEYPGAYPQSSYFSLRLDSTKKAMGAFTSGNYYQSFKLYSSTEYSYTGLCSYSFVDYLVQTYGFENTVLMFKGTTLDIYFKFHTKGLEGIVSDWYTFLSNYPQKLPMSELSSQMKTAKSSLGY